MYLLLSSIIILTKALKIDISKAIYKIFSENIYITLRTLPCDE